MVHVQSCLILVPRFLKLDESSPSSSSFCTSILTSATTILASRRIEDICGSRPSYMNMTESIKAKQRNSLSQRTRMHKQSFFHKKTSAYIDMKNSDSLDPTFSSSRLLNAMPPREKNFVNSIYVDLTKKKRKRRLKKKERIYLFANSLSPTPKRTGKPPIRALVARWEETRCGAYDEAVCCFISSRLESIVAWAKRERAPLGHTTAFAFTDHGRIQGCEGRNLKEEGIEWIETLEKSFNL
ncbi:hypothetical protein IEQ34_008792 [Dendrobium chrysotoxum]|uniref:Uncharacterized protein n=1 Tax=Dendrobium chrysotoxum TaxID=161865 RepID=A0AAV7GXL1_DENCH|nr:hypothetical protein IEQ34_008792 [Dendrobium chrysotoxum]